MMNRLERERIKLERGAEKATRWIGSTSSLIVHTIFFIFAFVLPFLGVNFTIVLLVLTTAVSLEAIYLSIFIQMSVNKNTQDIEIIQEDVGEIQKDVDEIQEDVDEIQEDMGEIQEDIGEQEEPLQQLERKEHDALLAIQKTLADLQKEIEKIKKI